MNKDSLNDRLINILGQYNGHRLNIMEVCGTHTMSIFKHGIKEILPQNINLISGPGCPVCVTPHSYIDYSIAIAKYSDTIILTFGDMLRVPGSEISLEQVRALGGDVRIIYSPLDALRIAQSNLNKKVVLLGIGFETTIPVIALTIKKAKENNIKNLYIFCGMKLIIPALKKLCNSDMNLDGFMLPGHVSAIIGCKPYEFLAHKHNKACAVTGFEAYDILMALYLILRQIQHKTYKIENAYPRVVKNEGNQTAYKSIFDVFTTTDSLWRGFGKIEESGLKLKSEYKDFDAKEAFGLGDEYEVKKEDCICQDVIIGAKVPYQCRLFDSECSPMTPVGACMVSSEGTCAAYYKYGRK